MGTSKVLLTIAKNDSYLTFQKLLKLNISLQIIEFDKQYLPSLIGVGWPFTTNDMIILPYDEVLLDVH